MESNLTPSNLSKNDLNKIKARLHSIPDKKMETLPLAVQKLLSVDIPKIIKELETWKV